MTAAQSIQEGEFLLHMAFLHHGCGLDELLQIDTVAANATNKKCVHSYIKWTYPVLRQFNNHPTNYSSQNTMG